MANPQTSIIAKQTICMAPWFFLGAVILGLATCCFGFAPLSYLFASFGLAVVWFALLVFSWRKRSDALRLLSLVFIIMGQQTVFRCLGDGRHFEIMQGCFVILAVLSALTMLLRSWIYKYARLDDHVA
jgi:hypothetical protein